MGWNNKVKVENIECDTACVNESKRDFRQRIN